jgi:potassium-transporting ATPase potassium-binding subunit
LDWRHHRLALAGLFVRGAFKAGEVLMTLTGWIQIAFYIIVLLLLVKPLGLYMARVYQGERTFLSPLAAPFERWLYRLLRIDAAEEMDWKAYALTMLIFNLIGFLFVYLLQRAQGFLPLNPQGMTAVAPDLALNTAVSFATNTNWQNYGGETTLSYLTQMVGLTVQNFVSAATGMAVLIAFTRALIRHNTRLLGNFWVDLTRSTLYILLPMSIVVALILVSQGVVQTFSSSITANTLQPQAGPNSTTLTTQTIAVGPAASQIAIKQLGTNGGGFFNANSAHPLENPTPFSNFVEMLSLILIPAALCYTFGKMVGDTRQGWAILTAMTLVLAVLIGVTYWAEQKGNPLLTPLGVDQTASATQSGGNMEGKELRFGPVNSAIWATATTAASNGSVNSMHDSFTPLGGLVTLTMLMFGEVIFGGVGSGLYGMLVFVIVAVFVAGLMVGRTPEYLGKKIEAYEMKMASLLILIMPLTVLALTAVAVLLSAGQSSVLNPGPHGFSEILYAFASQGNNNGSAFAGLTGNVPFYNLTGALAMLISRYWLAVPTLALAGSLVVKKKVPTGTGTLSTTSLLFIVWLIGIVVLVGALNFVPALALGPVIEHIIMMGG